MKNKNKQKSNQSRRKLRDRRQNKVDNKVDFTATKWYRQLPLDGSGLSHR